MRLSDEEIRNRLDQFKAACRHAGLKLTHQRIEVFREVARTDDHPDAETVYRGVRRRVPTVSLDTVYRTLWMLIDLGLLNTLGPPQDRVRFDANTNPHHHFVCRKCGAAHDFTSREFDVLRAPDAVRKLGSVATIHVEFRGVCARCLNDTDGK